MLGFSKKRFFITLGLSILIWIISALTQAFLTAGKYIATFTQGCQATGYPIDICNFPRAKLTPLFVDLINLLFWFWVIHFGWKWFAKRK